MRKLNRPLTTPNITPLCDAAMTLIVIFMMTLPAMLWSGITIQATKAMRSKRPVTAQPISQRIIINLTEQKTYVNGKVVEEEELKSELENILAALEDRTVIVVSDPQVLFGRVVEAFDIAKQAGADKLALLKKRKRISG